MTDTYENTANGGLNDALKPEDARRLRGKAWRHIHRINPVKARELWRKVKEREPLEVRPFPPSSRATVEGVNTTRELGGGTYSGGSLLKPKKRPITMHKPT
jgi:hypothetical protein